MKKLHLLLLATTLVLLITGCKKDSSQADLASMSVGIYDGTWTVYGQNVGGTCELTKVSATSVNVAMTIIGTTIPTLPGVKLSDAGNGEIKLNYSDPSGTATGSIKNNTITITIDDGDTAFSFSGSK